MVRQSLWMLLATFLFAVVALLVKKASDFYSVWELIFYRSIFGVALCGFILKEKHISLETSHPWRHLIRCAIGTTCITLGVYTLSVLPLGTAQTFTYSSPLWFCLFLSISAAFARQKLEKPLLLAVAVGFGGVLLILRPDFPEEELIGALAGVLVGLTGGGADFMIRDLSRHAEPPERIVFYFTLTGTLAGLIASAVTGFSPHTLHGILLIIGIGIAATCAQLCLTIGWTYGHPLLNSVYQFAGIPFAVIFGLIFFGESLDFISLLGMAIVTLAGMTASVLRIQSERTDIQQSSPD